MKDLNHKDGVMAMKTNFSKALEIPRRCLGMTNIGAYLQGEPLCSKSVVIYLPQEAIHLR